MRVIDLINSNEKTAFSFEILPPLKGTGIEKLYQTIDTLREFDPKYINITTHRSEYVYKDLGNGLFQRNRLRRRPGTVAVAAAIQNKYNITMVPHILCSGFTREETEYVLLDLQFLGITDLLVLRGDKAKHESSFIPVGNGYHHAVELQEQINNFNKGIFVDGSEMKVTNTPFSYGVACYPEKHEEAPNMDTDIYWLKKKNGNGCRVCRDPALLRQPEIFRLRGTCPSSRCHHPDYPGHQALQEAVTTQHNTQDVQGRLARGTDPRGSEVQHRCGSSASGYRMVRAAVQRADSPWRPKPPLLLGRSHRQHQGSSQTNLLNNR